VKADADLVNRLPVWHALSDLFLDTSGAPAPGRRRRGCRRTWSSRGDRFRNSDDADSCRISFGSPPARIRACPCAEPTQLVGAGGGLNKNQAAAAGERHRYCAKPNSVRDRVANSRSRLSGRTLGGQSPCGLHLNFTTRRSRASRVRARRSGSFWMPMFTSGTSFAVAGRELAGCNPCRSRSMMA
jgi:hypothetical protein